MLSNLDEFKKFTATLVEASSKVIVPYFANPDLFVEFKADDSPVTVADRNAEAVMRELIIKHYPNHGIIGEEFGTDNEAAEFVWVLDPIDGTISFAGGVPLFGTLIALLHKGQPVLGAIHQPVLKQFCLGDNETTTLNGRPVQVRQTNTLIEATLLTTDILNIARHQNHDKFDVLLNQVRLFRMWGDCYGYLLLASGWVDIMLDPIMNPWDILPIIPVIQGAGGVITDWNGKSAVEGTSCIAASPQLHGLVLAILNANDK